MTHSHVRGAKTPEPSFNGIEGATWLGRLFKTSRADPEPRAIREAALGLEREGAAVFAALDGWPRPPIINGFVPDVYAIFEDREIVLDFENEGSAGTPLAERQDAAFVTWAAESSRRTYEQIVVPGGRGGRA